MKNYMKLQFPARTENEAFVRVSVAAFIAQLDPTLDELTELKTAVSEAVSNAIIHGYEGQPNGEIELEVSLDDEWLEIIVRDHGIGIKNITEARQPLYTSKPELERSGMGFTIMENFMDEVDILSRAHEGTTVRLRKKCSSFRSITHGVHN